MSSYNYRRSEWLKFRAACLENAEDACERCGRTNVILQIHHPEYVAGKELWEYPIEFFEVICRRCHAEIHKKIKPSGGWIILHSDLDYRQPSSPIPCENCGLQIQWHFTIYHPEWGQIVVGSECAENLHLGPEIKKLKSYHRRLRTFIVSPRWKPTPKGFKITYQNYSDFVLDKENHYCLNIGGKWGTLKYKTIDDAKEQAFVKIESLINKYDESVG